jgi:hypothetical protein
MRLWRTFHIQRTAGHLGKTCSSGTQTNAEVAAKPLKLKAKMAAKKHGDKFQGIVSHMEEKLL